MRRGSLALHTVPPARPVAGDVVVQVSHVGLCGSDLPKLSSPDRFDLPEPWRPGHEIVGTDPAGRTVVVDPLLPCRACGPCVLGDTHLCAHLRRIGGDLPGGFADEVAVPARNLHPLPAGVDPARGVLVDPAAVAVHGLRCNPVGPIGRLAVIGAGTIGLLTALHAIDQGWDVTVLYRAHNPPPALTTRAVPAAFRTRSTLARDGRFDVVVDAATGSDASALELALSLVRDGGTVVVQNAYLPGVTLPTPLRDVFRRSISVVGAFSHCQRGEGDVEHALRLLDMRTAQVGHLLQECGELSDLSSALDHRPPPGLRQVLAVRLH